ncbi:hypothetical protein NP493_114g04041 [Ridgeia piscesae]|uniref:Uncharacterized protein n=1 Tax=Ridgeia piscesae TaxID=27915 RepID=A0AAD9UH35_RIDPI|nr:hypothetical protein NP493_114g04041 [Ridgeia piscesae]
MRCSIPAGCRPVIEVVQVHRSYSAVLESKNWASHWPRAIEELSIESVVRRAASSVRHTWLGQPLWLASGWRREGVTPGQHQRDGTGRLALTGRAAVRRSSPRRSMREGKRRFFHPADEGHTALSIMKSEPLAVLAAGLLILSCLVTGECLLCKRGDCRMGSVWSEVRRGQLSSVCGGYGPTFLPSVGDSLTQSVTYSRRQAENAVTVQRRYRVWHPTAEQI